MRYSAAWVALFAALAVFAALASSARAVVVRMPNGRLAGVTPIAGVNPTSLPGSQAKPLSGLSSNGNLDYHNGPVLHAVTPYLIFWDPSGSISTTERNLLARYFADSAADSGGSSDVFGVDRQFTDSTGFADYNQTWSASHIINDTQAYPTTGNCTDTPVYGETVCLFDSQLQAEVARLVAAGSLPTGTSGTAPIYFVVTPPNVNSCFPGGGNPDQCADNTFCAYHSSFVNVKKQTILYANIPTVLAVNDPKGCQADGIRAVQSPNGNSTADVTIKYMSHEFNETITDPLGNAWWDSNSGNEDGDNCNFFGPFDPQGGENPNAFSPTLGGSTSPTLYDQLINSDHYYTQSEWSNGDVNCEMQPSNGSISAAFSAPSSAAPGASVTFNPASSTSTGGWTSATWSWGDGSSSFSRISAAPTSTTHSFTTAGTYTVTLTLVDTHGDISTVSHQITIGTVTTTASFTSSPTSPAPGTSVSFDASASSSTGGPITSYAWNWGDGSNDTTSSATDSHAYSSTGPFTVTLTVTDSGNHTGHISHIVTVVAAPVAAFAVTTSSPTAGSPVAFDGSGSTAPAGTISSYSWSFGDGSSPGTGVSPSHTYSAAGTYTVSLTVTDSNGNADTVSHSVIVASGGQPAFHGVPRASISVTNSHPVAGTVVGFSGAGSTDAGSTIVSYSWNFGDGSTATGARPTHVYARTGRFTVQLTVTDATGSTSTTSGTLKVVAASIGAIKLKAGAKVEVLTIALTGAGTLHAGKAHVTVTGATSVHLRITLSRSQRTRLRHHHKVTIHLTLRFQPNIGPATTQHITIHLTAG